MFFSKKNPLQLMREAEKSYFKKMGASISETPLQKIADDLSYTKQYTKDVLVTHYIDCLDYKGGQLANKRDGKTNTEKLKKQESAIPPHLLAFNITLKPTITCKHCGEKGGIFSGRGKNTIETKIGSGKFLGIFNTERRYTETTITKMYCRHCKTEWDT